MDIHFTISAFLHLLATILGFATGVIMWIFPRKVYTPNKLYGCSLIALSIGLGISFLIETHLILKVPHVYRTGNVFGLLFMPFSYLYLRSLVRQKGLGVWDLVHALPALLFLIDFAPFYLLSAEEKRTLLQQDLVSMLQMLQFNQGWLLPNNFHLTFRHLTYFIYWLLQMSLFLKVTRLKNEKSINENRHWILWMRIILGLQVFFFLPFFVSLLMGAHQVYWIASQVAGAISLLFTAIYLLLRPDILYGFREMRPSAPEKPVNNEEMTSYNILRYMDEEEVERIMQTVEALMEEQKLYLQHGFTIKDLAKKTNIPNHQLSAIINREAALNFNEYLNRHRVQHCIASMQNGDWEKFTLEALAYECGFSNRNSFTLSFKKFTGLTPSAYIKQLK